jgi:YVTN family beta-propeller protein
MKVTKFKKYLLYVLLGTNTLLASSCDSNDDENLPTFENGAFVTNEGNYGTPTGEVSFISRTDNTVIPELFTTVNKRPLGDVVQSMTFANNKAYIVANNSQKIEVVDGRTFVSEGVINGLEMPRYFAALNGQKGYVTEWVSYSGAGRVAVLDLSSNRVSKTIPVGINPEALLLHNGKLYVINSGGNTISVINTSTDQVESTITVPNGPNSLVLDATGSMWVLCGRTFYNADFSVDLTRTTNGRLVKFNPATPNAQTFLEFPSKDRQPRNLVINGAGNRLYYKFGNSVYALSTAATALSSSALLSRSGIYGLGVDPKENTIYVGAGPYNSNGQVIRFQPSGAAIDSFQVRVLPNGFTFR